MSDFSITDRSSRVIGVVYDFPEKLEDHIDFVFPHDATLEWESMATINLICSSWESIGYKVHQFPLNKSFLSNWEKNISSCHLIHSLVEGFGSIAREGWIPSLCEISGVPYIGSNPFVHSLCMSKSNLKIICQKLNIPTPEFYVLKDFSDFKKIPETFFNEKHFIKPDCEGSGMGVDASHSISHSQIETAKISEKLLKMYPDGILIERFLSGKEFTTGIIGEDQPLFLPIAEVEVPGGVYGATYKGKSGREEKITFPKIPYEKHEYLKELSMKLFKYLDMKDFVRFDWKCNEAGEFFFLEANTLPGISKIYSIIPLMAEEAGINYLELLRVLAEGALARKNARNLWYGRSRTLACIN